MPMCSLLESMLTIANRGYSRMSVSVQLDDVDTRLETLVKRRTPNVRSRSIGLVNL